MGNIPGMKKPDIHALPQIKDAFPAHAGVIPTQDAAGRGSVKMVRNWSTLAAVKRF